MHLRSKLALTLVALLTLAAAAAAKPSIEPLTLITPSDNQKLSAYRENAVVFFSFSELVEVLGGRLDWQIIGHTISYAGNGHHFDFLLGSPFFKMDDKTYNQTYPAEYVDGQLFLPAQTFIPFLDGALTQKLTFHPDSYTLRIDSEYFNVVDLILSPKANGLLVEVVLTDALPYEVFLTEGNWLNISISQARMNKTQILSRTDRRFVYKVTTHQAADVGQISIQLREKPGEIHHKMVYDPPRIQIVLPIADFDLTASDTTLPVVGPDNKIDVVVVDAGHGGHNYGAIGPGRTREKDVTLGIARELAKLIRSDRQFRVVMTRDRDKFVSLEERAKIANQAGGDLFVSIHANASPKRSARGWNVFFLAPARNDSARAVAQFENSFFLREAYERNAASGTDAAIDDTADTAVGDTGTFESDSAGLEANPVLGILNEMIMTEFQDESNDFAMMVAKEFRRNLSIPSRGVDQAGFFVLNQVFTPSILIETGFISNSQEEKLLNSEQYQKQVAEAIYTAIKRFKDKYNKKS